MIPVGSSIAAGSLAIWVYLALGRGGFWRIRQPAQPALSFDAATRRIVAVIPARNEAETIRGTVESLLRQSYEISVIVVDDNSTDGTAEAARVNEKVTVLDGAPLPDGWTGKMWAVSQGVAQGRQLHPDYFLLTDADIIHAPDNVTGLLARAETERFDLVSLMVQLHCQSLPERLLIPAFVFFFFQLYPPAWIRNRTHNTAGAAGGCMLLSVAALDRIGGIEAIRGEVIDDCALARKVKQTGGGVWLGLASTAFSTRTYATFAEIWNMIARTAFTQLRYSTVLLVGTLAGLALLYAGPPMLALSGEPLALASWLLLSALYVPMLWHYELSPLWAPLLPVAAVFYLSATVGSAVRYWGGKGGQWKGRAQAPR